ncbi:MAG: hypothetical protein G01um101466_331 [Parcubacteria group bacterium Gr01-1014_66]|nr:MAG: hypothetical protein G01um101466_331 [Parcubacteria group bacterium Gr01-1014_66]
MQLTPHQKLHSRIHVLADDLSKALGEPKRFASYLGVAKHHYESDLRALLRRVLEKEDLPSDVRGKYFFAALKGLPKIKITRTRPKKRKIRRTKKKSIRIAKKSRNGKLTPNRKNS